MLDLHGSSTYRARARAKQQPLQLSLARYSSTARHVNRLSSTVQTSYYHSITLAHMVICSHAILFVALLTTLSSLTIHLLRRKARTYLPLYRCNLFYGTPGVVVRKKSRFAFPLCGHVRHVEPPQALNGSLRPHRPAPYQIQLDALPGLGWVPGTLRNNSHRWMLQCLNHYRDFQQMKPYNQVSHPKEHGNELWL